MGPVGTIPTQCVITASSYKGIGGGGGGGGAGREVGERGGGLSVPLTSNRQPKSLSWSSVTVVIKGINVSQNTASEDLIASHEQYTNISNIAR